jgi:SAM-dependent methyltransferase
VANEKQLRYPGAEHGSSFGHASVVRAYRHRPAYPAEVFDILDELLADEPRAVLDAGCGTGAVARRLVERVDRIDAVDISAPMIEAGRALSGGDDPRITWITAPIETAPLRPPYGIVTCGESIHWMDWDVALPRFRHALTPEGRLVILDIGREPAPWDADLLAIIERYSTNRAFQRMDVPLALQERGLFRIEARHRTTAVPFVQPIEHFVESFHGRASFSRERMTAHSAAAFDAAVRDLIGRHCGASVELPIVATLTWGRPNAPSADAPRP